MKSDSLPLFPDDAPPPQAARLGPRLRAQAEKGIFWGTSSWKYEGWPGSIYAPERYSTRGRFSRKRFEETCLAEYARTFPVVCGDFAFYQFPTPESWQRLFGLTPEDFLVALKVPESLTVARWPTHARYGTRAGRENEGFLRADLFRQLFAGRLEPYRPRLAPLIFEIGTFPRSTFPTADAFLERLDAFLGTLPAGFRYAVEIRNPEYLGPDYFSMLSSHNASHVFSAWTRMPELERQVALPTAFTADFVVARALLARGRAYEQAVATFQPYERTQEVNPGVRAALRALAVAAMRRKMPAFLFVNNRLEGHAPSTIEAIVAAIEP